MAEHVETVGGNMGMTRKVEIFKRAHSIFF